MSKENQTILLVDDDKCFAETFKCVLEYSGFTIEIAFDASEALRIIEQHSKTNNSFDLVVIDLNMPNMNGSELLIELKRRYSQLPVIIYTGYGDDIETAVKLMANGADDFICKGGDPENVVTRIRMLLEKAAYKEIKPIENILEQTIKRLLREKKELENRVAILENKIITSKDVSCKDDIFLGSIGELLRPFIHDLNNSILTIQTCLNIFDLAVKGKKKNIAKVDTFLKICNEEIIRLHMLLDDIRFLGYHQNPDLFSKIDINSLIKRISSQIFKRYQKPDIKLVLSKKLPEIQADKSSIEQIIKNLLMNAVEACDDSKGLIRVTTKMINNPPLLQIIVKDNGVGIDPATKDKIYDLHFTTKKMGFGIGLYLVKKAIEQHRGTICYDSIPNKGTTFVVTLPASREDV